MTLVSLVWVKADENIACSKNSHFLGGRFLLNETSNIISSYSAWNSNISGKFYYQEFVFLGINPGNLPESTRVWLKALWFCKCPGWQLSSSCPKSTRRRRRALAPRLRPGVYRRGRPAAAGGQISGMKRSPQTATILFSLATQNTTLTPGLLHTVKIRRPWRRSKFIRASLEPEERLTHGGAGFLNILAHAEFRKF